MRKVSIWASGLLASAIPFVFVGAVIVLGACIFEAVGQQPADQTNIRAARSNKLHTTNTRARGPQVAGVTKQTQRRWIDFAEIWVAIPIALTNCCANYSIISKVKMVY